MQFNKYFSDLINLIDAEFKNIEHWVEKQKNGRAWPIFMSIDLRISNFKMAHVDSNLFPAGFNNLLDIDKQHASRLLKLYLENLYQGNLSKIKALLLPEAVTRNKKYLLNLKSLSSIIRESGIDLRIGIPRSISNSNLINILN